MFDAVSASIISHLRIPNLFMPSNYTTSIFTLDRLTSVISPLKDVKYNVKNQMKIDPNYIKIEQSPQSETLDEFPKQYTSPNPIPRAIQNVVLRSTYDPTNNPNAAPRSTHNFRRTDYDALGIDKRSHAEPGKL